MLVALAIALVVMVTRAYRSDWPRDMFFDEKYYAKAAMELLAQREPTETAHPPLSTELMALGIMTLGGDRVVGSEPSFAGLSRFAVASDGTRALATAGEIILRARDGRQLARLRLGAPPEAIAFEGDSVYVLSDRLRRYAKDGTVLENVARPDVGTVRALAIGNGRVLVAGDEASVLYTALSASPRRYVHPTIAATAIPDGTQFFTVEPGGIVRAIDPTSGDDSKTLVVAGDPNGIAYTYTGSLFISRRDAPVLDVVDLVKQRLFQLPLANGRTGALSGGAAALGVVPRTQMVYVLIDGRVVVVEPYGWSPFAAIDVDRDARWLGMDGEGDKLLVAGPDRIQDIETGMHGFAWRFPGVVLCGVLVAVAYLLARRLFAARLIAYLTAGFLALDITLFAGARVGAIDIYLTTFVLIAWYFVVAAYGNGRWAWVNLFLAGLFLGFGITSKWSALFALAGIASIVAVATVSHWRGHGDRGPLDLLAARGRNALACVASFALIPLAVYGGAYHSWFGGPTIPSGQTMLQLIQEQLIFGTTLTTSHCEVSPWWSWPITLRGMHTAIAPTSDTTTAAGYFLGNPVEYVLALPALAAVAGLAVRSRSAALALVPLGVATQVLPWAFTQRVTFFYYFMPAIPFYALALAMVIALVWQRRRAVGITAAIAIAAVSLAMYPIVSELPIPNSLGAALTAIPTWQHDPAFAPTESCEHSMLSSASATTTIAIGIAYEALAVALAVAIARNAAVAAPVLRFIGLSAATPARPAAPSPSAAPSSAPSRPTPAPTRPSKRRRRR